jgi:hypothetical protein
MRAFAALMIAVALTAVPARAQTSYNAVNFGADVVGGGRGGAGTDDALLGGGRLFLGGSFTWFRFGVEGGVLYSRTFNPISVDFGAYASGDFFSLWLDPYLSLAGFIRLDLLARVVPSVGNAGFLPEASIGARVLGFSISLVAGTELGLALAPNKPQVGGTGEVRIGFDFIEIVQLGKHLAAQKTPVP